VNACEPVSTPADFWLSSGHHLLDRNDDGCVMVTDEFLKAYLARPEMIPPPDACIAEQTLHAALLSNPREPVAPAQIAAIEDADARENWGFMISWRDHVIQHPTLEAAYLAIVREGRGFPPLFVSQIVQVILRNMLDDCQDVFVLRAAEMFFRAQKLALHEGSLLAVDEEIYADAGSRPSPLVSLLGLQAAPDIDVLSEANAHSYWERSDSFDFAFDLTAGRRGVAALGELAKLWVQHLLSIDVEIEALTELRDATLNWYVGLDSNATRIGDTLWRGATLDPAAPEFLIGLYRLTFRDAAQVVDPAKGSPTYLFVAASADMTLRLKPQNLVTGLPVRHQSEVVS
jgi:hypothetical protein